jgi:hypothetical protein
MDGARSTSCVAVAGHFFSHSPRRQARRFGGVQNDHLCCFGPAVALNHDERNFVIHTRLNFSNHGVDVVEQISFTAVCQKAIPLFLVAPFGPRILALTSLMFVSCLLVLDAPRAAFVAPLLGFP